MKYYGKKVISFILAGLLLASMTACELRDKVTEDIPQLPSEESGNPLPEGSEAEEEQPVPEENTESEDVSAPEDETENLPSDNPASETPDVPVPEELPEEPVEDPEVPEEKEPLKRDLTAFADASLTVEENAKRILSEMTVEEKVGQMFISHFPSSEEAGTNAEKLYLGGYILFAKDFASNDVPGMTELLAEVNTHSNLPLFFGVDEEGGTVIRVSKYPAYRRLPFMSPRQLYKEGKFAQIATDAAEKSNLLLKLGLNLNLAPVCDLSNDPNDFIYERSFGDDPEMTAEYVSRVIFEMKYRGLGSVLKHFPGYGGNADTHTGISIDERDYETFKSRDFIPFKVGIEEGATMVMMSHNIVKCMDEELPVSISPKAHEILRKELGFDGIIITDDLSMAGVASFGTDESIAVLAVKAGNDLICTTDAAGQIPEVIRAVEKGGISEDDIDASVKRILIAKLELGIIKTGAEEQE